MTNQPENLLPPHDADAEVAYLSSLLHCEDIPSRRKLRGLARAEDFFSPQHGRAFALISRFVDADKPIDAALFMGAVRDEGILADVGGLPFVATLLEAMPTSADAGFYLTHGASYAERITGHSARRRAITEARRLLTDLMQPRSSEAAEAIIQRAITALWGTTTRQNKVEVFKLEQILHEWIDERSEKKSPALMTGCEKLDQYAGIFGFGKYTILAGRPSMGKSTAMRWLLGRWAWEGATVGLVACEEDRRKIAGNYLADGSEIHNDRLAYGALGADDWLKITSAVGTMSAWNWYGVDTAFTLAEVSTAVEKLATEFKCKVIGVDHLHLIALDRRGENEQREIKEISAKLKELAKRFGVVLIAAAQLSRPMKTAGIPPAPTLTDLRASGAIEEHADAAIFLHRVDYYRASKADKDNVCQFIIAKNRNGRRGMVKLRAQLEHQRFVDDLPFDMEGE